MTREEFKKTGFTGRMEATYNGHKYDVVNADFGDYTVGLDIMQDFPLEVYCEDIEEIATKEKQCITKL